MHSKVDMDLMFFEFLDIEKEILTYLEKNDLGDPLQKSYSRIPRLTSWGFACRTPT